MKIAKLRLPQEQVVTLPRKYIKAQKFQQTSFKSLSGRSQTIKITSVQPKLMEIPETTGSYLFPKVTGVGVRRIQSASTSKQVPTQDDRFSQSLMSNQLAQSSLDQPAFRPTFRVRPPPEQMIQSLRVADSRLQDGAGLRRGNLLTSGFKVLQEKLSKSQMSQSLHQQFQALDELKRSRIATARPKRYDYQIDAEEVFDSDSEIDQQLAGESLRVDPDTIFIRNSNAGAQGNPDDLFTRAGIKVAKRFDAQLAGSRFKAK